MPTYEYECRKCGNHFERFQSILAEPVKRCPKCHGSVHRVLSGGSGIIFKGSGFYETDYKHKGASSASTVNTDGGSGSGGGESKAKESSGGGKKAD